MCILTKHFLVVQRGKSVESSASTILILVSILTTHPQPSACFAPLRASAPMAAKGLHLHRNHDIGLARLCTAVVEVAKVRDLCVLALKSVSVVGMAHHNTCFACRYLFYTSASALTSMIKQ